TGNAGLGQLSISGGGTEANPYIIPGYSYLESHGTSSLSTLNSAFSAVNDYLFPEYSSILVTGTTDYVVFSGFSGPGNTPAFQYTISGKLNLLIAQALGMTPTNNLGAYFYNSSNIVFTNSTVSEAFPAAVFDGDTYYNVPYVSSLTFWNVTNSLIENSLICSQGSGLLIYNNANTDAGNHIWNNTFRNAAVISNGSFFGGSPIGLTVESNGNTVFNNLFDTVITVVSIDGPYANIYNNGNVAYHDAFNISRRPASSTMSFDGATLTGSIIGSTYQGGNFYYNYFGNGSS
ncbi:thermopsin precursor related protein, partial [mine drainage metagenome]